MSELVVRRLNHFYGSFQSLHDVDLACSPRGITCLLGPSGCGKSTLLRCIAGHERPSSGSILLGGEVLGEGGNWTPPERRNLGMVFQNFALFPHLTIWRNVAFGLRALPRRERKRRALDMLERMEVPGLADRYPHQCSGGQQQRVALARALAPRPRALLLDEPFSGLDTGLREQLRHEVRERLLRENLPTLLVTHDPDEALCCADRIVLMREGRVVQDGTPHEIWHWPVDAEAMAFFSPITRIGVRVTDGRVCGPLGEWGTEEADGEYELVLRPGALRPDPSGPLRFGILDQNPCGSHRHVTLAVPDTDPVRIQIPDVGEVDPAGPWMLDTTLTRLFPKR